MKKICFLLLPVAVLLASVISCSSAPQNSESASANAALDNIFARKSVRTYLNKGVEKEKIDLMLRAGMAAPSGKDLRPWEFYVITERASLDSMARLCPMLRCLLRPVMPLWFAVIPPVLLIGIWIVRLPRRIFF